MRLSLVSLTVLLGLTFSVRLGICADETEPADSPYTTLWIQIGQLLADREYGSAADLIADAQTDPELAPYRNQLATDSKDIAVLQRFTKLVTDTAAELKMGDPLKLGSIDYKVVEFISDAKGERLVLTAAKSTTRIEKSITELDHRSWIELTQSKLTTSADDRHMLGMYLATVARGNRKEARQSLNLAAADGQSVSHWIARIDAEAKIAEKTKVEKKAVREDRILGTWRVVIGERGKPQSIHNSTFRADGKVIHTPAEPNGTAPPAGTWRKRGDGRYAVTNAKGGTVQWELDPTGEKMRGQLARGIPVRALRQAKTKK